MVSGRARKRHRRTPSPWFQPPYTSRGRCSKGAGAAHVLPPGARFTSATGRRGRSLRVRRRTKPGGVSRRINDPREVYGIFAGESFVLMPNLDVLSFLFHPCLWRIWGVCECKRIYFFQLCAVATLHLLPPGKCNFKTYGKVKGTQKSADLAPRSKLRPALRLPYPHSDATRFLELVCPEAVS